MSPRSVLATLRGAPAWVLGGLIRGYQLTISPLTGPTCKYYPSCSHYGLTAVRRHGALRGGTLAAWRVLRCNPWSHGGVDDVPLKGEPLFRRTSTTSAEASVSVHAT
ncbi:membrane protein insertion efficiency factor YidD [Demequina sp. NBRC 110057]|uniref:membrane protein insertion efficiency factor YidD n=1 Tax=Demequina sp. NBRC 110057 TaxID=1570346 RepID=UPI000A05299B|nr:membrane protein insertion efficiency factor YidD [Demequina sp. NBRC 110057]